MNYETTWTLNLELEKLKEGCEETKEEIQKYKWCDLMEGKCDSGEGEGVETESERERERFRV